MKMVKGQVTVFEDFNIDECWGKRTFQYYYTILYR